MSAERKLYRSPVANDAEQKMPRTSSSDVTLIPIFFSIGSSSRIRYVQVQHGMSQFIRIVGIA